MARAHSIERGLFDVADNLRRRTRSSRNLLNAQAPAKARTPKSFANLDRRCPIQRRVNARCRSWWLGSAHQHT